MSTDTVPSGISSSEVPGRVPGDRHPFPIWPVYGLILPAFVAIWSGWVGLGQMAGFGPVQLFPGISTFTLNTAITLPIGMETYAAFALGVWLSGRVPVRARAFAKRSVIWSLAVGAGGQVVYHLLAAAHAGRAPWPITMLVACLPVAVLGMGAALAHLIRSGEDVPEQPSEDVPAQAPQVPEPPADVPEQAEPYWNPFPELTATTLADAPVSPAPSGTKRRTSQELVLAADALALSEPDLNQVEIASRLGISDSRLRQARRAVRNGDPGE
jgi:hypothetical protein